MKDPLLLNKIAASVLAAMFVLLMIDFVVDEIVLKAHDGDDETQFAYNIEVLEQSAVSVGADSDESEEIESVLPLLASADMALGKKSAKKCTACHTFTKGGANRIGPNQWDIVARARGISSGFAYSEALLQSGESWDYESLNKFLYNPKAYIPHTKMNFVGIKTSQERANLILWLRSLSDNPVPLP